MHAANDVQASTGEGDLIAEAVACLRELAQGKSARAMQHEGPLADAIRELASSLQARAHRDLQRTVALSQAASESLAAVSFVTADVEEAMNSAQTIAAAVEQLTAAIAEIARAGREMTAEITDAEAATAAGLSAVAEAGAAMEGIARVVSETADKVLRLRVASKEIGQIVQVIATVAHQTNLLAFNATIEAARAGEAGKAFAVVAGEVKLLATETARANEQTRQQIGQIQGEVNALVEGIEQTRTAVASGEASILRVGEHIRTVVSKAKNVGVQTGHNAARLSEQTAATQEVADSASRISDKAERSTAHARRACQAVAGSEQVLQQQFQELAKLEIPDAIILLAKSDHTAWKKKLAQLLLGEHALEESELKDHRKCRLGAWYRSPAARALAGNPAFAALDEPHARVHQCARRVYEMFKRGDREAALRAYDEMSSASEQVLALLGRLERVS